ncbi:MAG TPA: hypothetical protein PLP18_02290 [Smithellaceae bacterium]|nr:hypothetical protein [Smithellaceae bacterium]
MSQYIDNVKDDKLSLHVVNRIMQYVSQHLVVSKIPKEIINSGNKITYNLTSLPIYLLKGHKSWSGIAVCFPGNKEDLQTDNIGTPYIRSILYPILELSRRLKEEKEGRFECIYIVGEYISEVLLRKFRLLKFLTPNLIVLSKNILALKDPPSIDKSVSPKKINEDFVQKLLCSKMLEPDGLSIPTRSDKITAGYIKHEMKTQRGTKEPEKLDILAYDKNDGSLIAFEIKGPSCSRVELENLFLQGIEHQRWVEENKRAIKLFYEGPRKTAINTRKRVRLFLGFFGDSVPALFYNLRGQVEAEDRNLKIEFVRFYFDMFNELFVNRFPEPETVSCLMTPKPQQWSLRGDPYLWEEMFNHLATTKIPEKINDLIAIIEKAFIELTAHPITYSDNIYIDKHNHGGMSSGYIDPLFWKNKVIPLLVERYEKFYRK